MSSSVGNGSVLGRTVGTAHFLLALELFLVDVGAVVLVGSLFTREVGAERRVRIVTAGGLDGVGARASRQYGQRERGQGDFSQDFSPFGH